MKKVINRPSDVVSEMLEGMAKADPRLTYYREAEVIARREKTAGKVGLVSGGGSGHEPAHAGYVGKGMLDAAVAGNVFASPSPDRILKGIEEADTGNGVLLIIKNYSGDIMNFGMAKDLAEMDGHLVDSVVVKDDVAVPDSTFSTGRRGIAGTVFVHKIAGAKAETGASLQKVKEIAEKTITNVTLIFSAPQALLAARAGATYVSPFLGRLDDIGQEGMALIEEIAEIFSIHEIPTEIIAASIRNPMHVSNAARAGSHIATVPYKVIKQMIGHPLTTIGIERFLKDWENVPK